MASTPYLPLNPGHIRVLKLSSDLSATLETFSLDDAPAYKALSYTWGDESDGMSEIVCDGHRISVRINLYNALHRLARDFGSDDAVFWIDALCIDQRNEREKSMQIPMMFKIFQQATEVLVWLGLLDAAQEDALAHANSVDVGWECSSGGGGLFARNASNDFWEAMITLLLAPWCERVWIVQEACANPHFDVLAGVSLRITWSKLMAMITDSIWAFTALKSDFAALPIWDSGTDSLRKIMARIPHEQELASLLHDGGLRALIYLKNPWTQIEDVRESLFSTAGQWSSQKSHGPVLTERLFKAFLGRTCSVNQDRVWGLTNLLQGPLVTNLEVDTTLSVRDLYIRVSRLWLLEDIEASYLPFITPDSAEGTLPSWCLDFRDMFYSSMFVDARGAPLFSAGISTEMALGSQGDVCEKSTAPKSTRQVFDEMACITAVFVDRIDKVAEHCGRSSMVYMYESAADIMARADWLLYLETMVSNALGAAYFKPLWRTLIWDRPRRMDDGTWSVNVDMAKGYEMTREKLARGEPLSLGQLGANAQESYHIYIKFERYFFLTSKPHFGSSVRACQPGDEIIIIPGTRFPFIVRPVGNGNYRLRGAAYVDGIMYGELMQPDESKKRMKTYNLI